MAGLKLEKIEALAPDQSSLAAARKLLTPSLWPNLSDDGAGLVWGQCQGSGATPYRVVICETDSGYKCSCPSRKFPCKHSLALMWIRAEGKASFVRGEAPEWVRDWMRRRRPGGATASEDSGEPAAVKSIAQAAELVEEKTDAKAEERSRAARERNRAEREALVLAGLDDLDAWLLDQVEAGLAGFASRAAKACRTIAQRLVDAKASGLAARMENMPARIFSLPENLRAAAAVQELGQLHLLAEAYRRQQELPPALPEDARREVGWTQSREALLEDEAAIRATGVWRVVATVSETQADRLRRTECWLLREGAEDGPRFAVLIDYVPVSVSASSNSYGVGERMVGTLVFYPSPMPLRAQIAALTEAAQPCADELTMPAMGLDDALEEYERSLAAKPWLGVYPLTFREARVQRNGDRLYLCSGEVALPLLPDQASMAAPLLALAGIDGVGLWDGYFLRLTVAQTALGRWVSE